MEPLAAQDPAPGFLERAHRLAALPILLFLGTALSIAAGTGFSPDTETYPRVRYRPELAAESILGMWKTGFQRPMQAQKRMVALWGLADEDESRLSLESPGLALGLLLLEHGASLRIHEPRFRKEAAVFLEQAEQDRVSFHDTALAAATQATDLVLNANDSQYTHVSLTRTAELMRGKLVFDCVPLLSMEATREAGLAPFPIGGHGWPPWLDPEFLAFVEEVRATTPRDARILLLPSEPMRTTSPRARWYLLLNYALAPRALLIVDPSDASGTAPQFQRWVRERNREGLLKGTERARVLRETKAQWLLWFRMMADFRPQDWRLEEVKA